MSGERRVGRFSNRMIQERLEPLTVKRLGGLRPVSIKLNVGTSGDGLERPGKLRNQPKVGLSPSDCVRSLV